MRRQRPGRLHILPPLTPDLDAVKRAARRSARSARTGCDPALGTALARHVLACLPLPPTAMIAGYWPVGDEIDIRPLLEALHAAGHGILLPQTPPPGEKLVFRLRPAWRPPRLWRRLL
jgi:5-formyltetrahydrofolate cyclo-ligase